VGAASKPAVSPDVPAGELERLGRDAKMYLAESGSGPGVVSALLASTGEVLAQIKKVNEGLGADESQDLFMKTVAACKAHCLFKFFQQAFLADWDEQEHGPWEFCQNEPDEELELFVDYLSTETGLSFVEETSASETSNPRSVKSAAAATVPVRAATLGGADSRQDETDESDAGCEDVLALLLASEPEPSGPTAEPTEPRGDAALRLKQPRPFHRSDLWPFLQQAWEKLSESQRAACKRNLTKSSHFRGDSAVSLPSVVTMCSGSGMAELAHRVLTLSLGHREVFWHACEKETFKKRHLLEYVQPLCEQPAAAGHGACLFGEFADLANGYAYCNRHRQVCEVKHGAFLALVGYSCKNLSRLNPASNVGVLRAVSGSSGETCQSLLRYLRFFRPVVCLLENVEEMARDEDDSDNVAFFLSSLEGLDYSFATRVMDSSRFGLPQTRRRAWQVLLNRNVFMCEPAELDQIALRIMSTAADLGCQPEPAADFLDEDDDPYLEELLLRKKDSAAWPVGTVYRYGIYVKSHHHIPRPRLRGLDFDLDPDSDFDLDLDLD
jgi:hypothetical protein